MTRIITFENLVFCEFSYLRVFRLLRIIIKLGLLASQPSVVEFNYVRSKNEY